MEFMLLAIFMLFVAVGFFGLVSNRLIQANEGETKQITEDIASYVYNEIDIAISSKDGYARTFVIPQEIDGIPYNLTVIDGRELVVNYLGYEHVKFLPANVTGNLSIGVNQIKKQDGIVMATREGVNSHRTPASLRLPAVPFAVEVRDSDICPCGLPLG